MLLKVSICFLSLLAGCAYAPAPTDEDIAHTHQQWISAAANIPDWSWSDSGTWNKSYAECGKGLQSPIDIPANAISKCPDEGFGFKNLNSPRSNIVLLNSYRGAILQLDSPDFPLVVTGGPLPKGQTFYVHDLFFHVGSNSSSGSLHTLQGKSFPMEIRVDMSTNPLGFQNSTYADLSFFVEVSADNERDNPNFEPIVQAVSNIKDGGSQTQVTIASLGSLLPQVPNWTSNHNSYVGSWVNPPCRANVTRVVFSTPIKLSERQIQAFRQIKDEKKQPIVDNVRRPTSTLDNRPVANCKVA